MRKPISLFFMGGGEGEGRLGELKAYYKAADQMICTFLFKSKMRFSHDMAHVTCPPCFREKTNPSDSHKVHQSICI